MANLFRLNLLLLVAIAACEPAGPPFDPIVEDPSLAGDTLPVIGHGLISMRYTAEVAVRGSFAYTSTWNNRAGVPGNAVFVWDVAGDVPVLVDSLIINHASTTGDVQISDDGTLLVVATEYNNGSIVIYDLTDPAHPAHLSTFSSDSTASGVHTVKLGRVAGRHYAFLSVDPRSQPTTIPARLVIVDITDPGAPFHVWGGAMGNPYVHDVFVRDGLLFTALWHDGVTIWDIGGGNSGGSPSNPVEIVSFQAISGYIHNLWWFHDPSNNGKRYLFLGEEGPSSLLNSSSGDIHVFDISDIEHPRQVAFYTLAGAGTHNFSMDEASGVLYAAYYNGGVRAIDVRGDLEDCTTTQRSQGLCNLRLMGRELGVALTEGSYVWGVAYQAAHVYASDMRNGLYKIDALTLVR